MSCNYMSTRSYSRFNIEENESDIHVFVRDFRDRVNRELESEDEHYGFSPFITFADKITSFKTESWLKDNETRFFNETSNDTLIKQDYLSDCGFINAMSYSEDGENIIVGHASGLVQSLNLQAARCGSKQNLVGLNMDALKQILKEEIRLINDAYEDELNPKLWYPMFYSGKLNKTVDIAWVQENYSRYLKGGPNEIMYNRWYFSEMGFITALEFAPNGAHIIVGHSSGLIQMRHGSTGTVLCTLRNIQFPPKPIYALEYSKKEERVCYAACMDGSVYRIEIPQISASVDDPPKYCIRADPALECLTMQFYGAPGIASHATPFVSQRPAALSLGLSADQTKMVVGYADTSIKVYDMETQEADITYKVHKLRLQFVPKKLQRMHFGQVCALKCHATRPFMFASGAWDKTLRIWDVRCKVGCVMTFEGVDICSDSIDLNRNYCLTGSWQATEALALWDLVAKKKIAIVRVQNRRPDVDGEFIYACKFWNSADYNRKGKYAIIGGSGTNCVEVINLHNRYISCSYPAAGNVLSVTSHQDRIAFGGTATTFNIVRFYDPKHEKDKYHKEVDEQYSSYDKGDYMFDDSPESQRGSFVTDSTDAHKSQIATPI